MVKNFLTNKGIPLNKEGTFHELSKLQRYNILRKIYKDKDIDMSVKT